MKAIVTIVCGESYRRNFSHYCYPGWNAYAKKHGFDLVIFDEVLDSTPRAQARSVAWQKCLAIIHQSAAKYEQVAWLDSDIVINAQKAPNIFEGVEAKKIAAVPDFVFPDRARYRKRLEYFYRQWELLGTPYVKNLTPEEFMTSWGLPAQPNVVQTGVLVACPQIHGRIFKHTYDSYEDRGTPDWNYEMRPLSYEILQHSAVHWLDFGFNVIPLFGVTPNELSDYFPAVPGLAKRALRKLRPRRPEFEEAHRLRPIYERLFDDSYFLHFAGCQSHIAYLQSRLTPLIHTVA